VRNWLAMVHFAGDSQLRMSLSCDCFSRFVVVVNAPDENLLLVLTERHSRPIGATPRYFATIWLAIAIIRP
jgi:hypothetical protein